MIATTVPAEEPPCPPVPDASPEVVVVGTTTWLTEAVGVTEGDVVADGETEADGDGEVGDGRSALTLLAQRGGPLHLLLTDVVMPEMNGRQLAEELTAARPDLKVLFMSGYADAAVMRHGALPPGVSYLPKPFTPEALARKVRAVLDG